MTLRLRSSVLTTIAACVVAAGTLAPLPSATAVDAAAPTILFVRADGVGGPDGPYVSTECFMSVGFRDTTHSGIGKYRLSVTDPTGLEVLAVTGGGPSEGEGRPDEYSANFLCDDKLVDGVTYTYTLTETSPDADLVSDPLQHQFLVTGHPERTTLAPTAADGTALPVGQKISLVNAPREWEAGTRFYGHRVWVSKTLNFTEADRDANLEHGGIVSSYDVTTTPLTTFTIPKKYVGHYIWVSTTGAAPTKSPWSIAIKPFIAVASSTPPPATDKPQPGSWVTAYPKVTQNPKVGSVARFLKKPVFSSAARAAGLRVSYAWVINNRTLIKGATRTTYKVPAKYRGKRLSLVLVMNAPRYVTKVKAINAGTIR